MVFPKMLNSGSKFGFLAAITLLLLLPTGMRSQNISDLIKDLGIDQVAAGYLKPAADAVGYSFNSGLYHTAEVEQGLHLWVGVRGVWTFVPSEEMTFKAVLPPELAALGYPADITTATVFGDKGALITSSDPQNPEIQLPDGINQKSTYFILPHVTVGSFAGLELMLRGIPPVTFDKEIGKVSFFGAGLKFSPTSLVSAESSIFHVAFMVAAQQFNTGDYLVVTNYNANVHGSVDLGPVTLFSGLGYESYNIDVSYTYSPPVGSSNLPIELDEPQSIELAFLRRNLRYTIGANVTLIPLVNFTADYSFGVQDNFSFGAGITF
jgi:uncharacterized protein DUF6588